MNLDAVPYMTTLGGQAFSQAYSQLYQQMFFSGVSPTAVTAQPFFEAALGGGGSAFCKGYASCTQAVAVNYGSLIKETARIRSVEQDGRALQLDFRPHHVKPAVAGGTT